MQPEETCNCILVSLSLHGFTVRLPCAVSNIRGVDSRVGSVDYRMIKDRRKGCVCA